VSCLILAACAIAGPPLSALEGDQKPVPKKGLAKAPVAGAKSATAPAGVVAAVPDPAQRRRRASLKCSRLISTTKATSPRFKTNPMDRESRPAIRQWCRSPGAEPSAWLPADVGLNLGIAQIGHPELRRPQPLRAQPLAARGHALLRGAGLCLFAGRGHRASVTFYGRRFYVSRRLKILRPHGNVSRVPLSYPPSAPR
jgi:hypothetical protein